MPDAIALDIVEIRGFAGDHQGQGQLVLADIYSPDGSQNLYIDKSGRLRVIDGYAKQNSAAIVTDTGATAATFRSMFPYRATIAGTTTRQLLAVLDDEVNEWEIWKSTDQGVNWTFVSDRGATPVGQLPDWAISGQYLYITVPKTEIPRVWDGTTLAAAGATRLAAPTTVSNGTGVLTGTYQWRIVPVTAATGLEKAGSAVSTPLQLQSLQATVTWAADADTGVGGYNIYRLTGTGKIFYFETFVTGRTTVTYNSNVADLVLISHNALNYHGDAPPSGVYFCENHKQRMWWGRTDTNPRRWYYADPGAPDSINTDNSYLDFTDGDSLGDVTVGATGDFNNMLVAWLERSVWTVSGTGQVLGAVIDWSRRRSNAQAGTVHHRTVLRIPDGARYTDADGNIVTLSGNSLAYFSSLKDIRVFDGQNDRIISYAKQDDCALLNYQYRTKAHAAMDTQRKIAMWLIPTTGSECDTLIAWDYGRGAWYTWTPTPFASLVEIESSTVAQILLASAAVKATGGYVYQLWSGNSFDTADITATWVSKALYARGSGPNQAATLMFGQLGNLATRKRHRYVILMFESVGAASLTLSVLSPHAVGTATAAFSMTGITPARLQKVPLQDPLTGQHYHHHGLRLRLTSTGHAGAWILGGIAMAFQELPGLKRSMLST